MYPFYFNYKDNRIAYSTSTLDYNVPNRYNSELAWHGSMFRMGWIYIGTYKTDKPEKYVGVLDELYEVYNI